jgi:hypothetical protein
MDQAPGGDDVLLVLVAQVPPADGDQAADEQDEGHPAEQVEEPAGRLVEQVERAHQDRQQQGQHGPSAVPDEHERVLVLAYHEPLARREHRDRVRHPPEPPQARGWARA